MACLLVVNCDDIVDDTNDGIIYVGGVYKDFVELPTEYYYSSEVFDYSYLDIYGFWNCYQVSSGWTGLGYDPDLYFEIKPYGIWGIIENDTLQDFGKIEILDPSWQNAPLVNFKSDDSTKLYLYDLEKYIKLLGTDTLLLEAPCCDRDDYYFVREASFPPFNGIQPE